MEILDCIDVRAAGTQGMAGYTYLTPGFCCRPFGRRALNSARAESLRLIMAAAFAGLMLTTLSGCETGEPAQDPAAESAAVEDVTAYEAEAGLSPRQRIRKAITLLETGEAQPARAELIAYLDEVPQSTLARGLLQQIDGDPVDMLGSEHFTYTLQADESLSIVSKRMLGDALKFYVLARYNGMENPSLVKAGQIIKVPGTSAPPSAVGAAKTEVGVAAGSDATTAPSQEPEEEAVEARVTPTPALEEQQPEAEQVAALLVKGDRLSTAGDYQSAIHLLEEGLLQFPANRRVSRQLSEDYLSHADQLKRESKLDEAIEALKRGAELDPGNVDFARRITRIEALKRADDLYLIGVRYRDQNAPLDAYQSFSKAVELSPEHVGARQELSAITPLVVETYHRQAMTAFQRQDLDTALGIWNRVLEIDPNYQPAKLYQARALELKEHLRGIEDQE